MTLEARQFNPTDGEPTLIGSLPKSFEEYDPSIQRYIQAAERQDCNLLIKQALVTYALYRYGNSPKLDSQRTVRILTTREISATLGITENDIKIHQRLIEQEGLPAWQQFETALLQPTDKKSKKERMEEIKALMEQGLNSVTIASKLNISPSGVRKYIKELQKTTPPITP